MASNDNKQLTLAQSTNNNIIKIEPNEEVLSSNQNKRKANVLDDFEIEEFNNYCVRKIKIEDAIINDKDDIVRKIIEMENEVERKHEAEKLLLEAKQVIELLNEKYNHLKKTFEALESDHKICLKVLANFFDEKKISNDQLDKANAKIQQLIHDRSGFIQIISRLNNTIVNLKKTAAQQGNLVNFKVGSSVVVHQSLLQNQQLRRSLFNRNFPYVNLKKL